MLAYAVHLADGRAGLEQALLTACLSARLMPSAGRASMGRAAAREQEDHAVVFAKVADQFEHSALGHGQSGRIRDRMRGFDHFDFLARRAVAIAGDHQAADFTFASNFPPPAPWRPRSSPALIIT